MADLLRWSMLGAVDVPLSQILIVDDSPIDAALTKRALEPLHATLRTASDGGQAHALFSMHQPDFVVLDLMLPGESGFEICQRFKAIDSKVPVLILSAIDMDDARQLARRVGADGYLVKPISQELLIDEVRRIAEHVWRQHHLEQPTTEPERIRFLCRCGKKFKVSAAHQGKSMTCPSCGEFVLVPKISATV